MKILGIDESGRGPVIGSMVMCGYMIDDENKSKLEKIGVKDSKLLTKQKRNMLYTKLRKMAHSTKTIKVGVKEIDARRSVNHLNKLEIEKMIALIDRMKPDLAIIDAPEKNEKGFKKKIVHGIGHSCDVIAENFADKKHLEVGAASIIAKVTRDREIEKLHKTHGYFGSGYPSDPETIAYLRAWLKKNKDFPSFVRKSWMTVQVMKREKQQTTMGKFV